MNCGRTNLILYYKLNIETLYAYINSRLNFINVSFIVVFALNSIMKCILLIHQRYLHHFRRLCRCRWIALGHRMKCFVAFELTFVLLAILRPLLNIMKMHAPIHRPDHVCHCRPLCHLMHP